MRSDVGFQDRGVLEHGLPVGRAQPGIVIGAGPAVAGIAYRFPGGDRGGGQGLEMRHAQAFQVHHAGAR